MRLRQVEYTPHRDYATVGEVAKILDVAPDLLRGLIAGGKLDAVESVTTKGNKVVMVPRAEVKRLGDEMAALGRKR